jgi:CBS-domain-containing membrane protein
MRDGHIHRIVIVDERRRPVGVVSGTDVLAAVARLDRLQEAEGL